MNNVVIKYFAGVVIGAIAAILPFLFAYFSSEPFMSSNFLVTPLIAAVSGFIFVVIYRFGFSEKLKMGDLFMISLISTLMVLALDTILSGGLTSYLSHPLGWIFLILSIIKHLGTFIFSLVAMSLGLLVSKLKSDREPDQDQLRYNKKMKTITCVDCEMQFEGETKEDVMKAMMPHYGTDHKEMMERGTEEGKKAWFAEFNKRWEEA